MVDDNQEPQPIRRSRPIVWITGFAVVVVLAILVLPAIQAARDAARRMSSENNLKQIGLGMHNYHDAIGSLPSGGTFREDGTGLHGWSLAILPFLEGGSVGVDIDKTLPWDDPTNIDAYEKRAIQSYRCPGLALHQTPEGIPLTHYAANEWLLHRNSRVTLDEVPNPSSTLLVGDAFGEFRPWADVYNWRDPSVPFRTSPRQFGSTIRKTTLVALVDGSVGSFGPTIDDEVFAQLAGPAELRPSPELVERPTRPYQLETQEYWRFLYCAKDQSHFSKGGNTVRFRLSPDAHYLEASVNTWGHVPKNEDGKWRTKFKSFVQSKPIEHVKISGKMDAKELEPFLEIPTLKRLSLSGATIYGDRKAVIGKARKNIEID